MSGISTVPFLILTGPPGAGKSTVARLLADGASGNAIHLHTDDFYGYIRKGYIAPYLPEAQSQNAVVIAAIVSAAFSFARDGYEVFLDGIVGPWFLDPFREASTAAGIPIDYVVLRPGGEVSLRRAQARPAHALKDEAAIRGLSEAFADLGPLEVHCIDTSAQTPAQTAAFVATARQAGRFRLT